MNTVSLTRIRQYESNYVAIHNANYSAVQAALNQFETDYLLASEANQPNGFLALNSSGMVPEAILPDPDVYQLASGRDSDYAGISDRHQNPDGTWGPDGTVHGVPSYPSTMPEDPALLNNLLLTANKGSTYVPLDIQGFVPLQYLDPAVLVLQSQADTVGGWPRISADTGKIQDRFVALPDMSIYQAASERDRPNGYAGLNEDRRIPVYRFDLAALRTALGLP
jgi:hypothetical protein